MSRWWITYDYGWYLEPYCSYATKAQALDNLMRARRYRPNAKIKLQEQESSQKEQEEVASTVYILTKTLDIVMVGVDSKEMWKDATLEVHDSYASAALAKAWYLS